MTFEAPTDTTKKGVYQEIARRVRTWLEIHKGETFDLDLICRQLRIGKAESRQYVAIELARKVKKGLIDKNNRIYRYVDTEAKVIDWVNATVSKSLDISWPYGIDDQSRFGFDGSVVISPKDIIVIAGVSNMGKTGFCLNFLWRNMEKFPCTLMGNEYQADKFKRRVEQMSWANPLKEDGTPKFELIERRDNWKDVIRPNHINIIDWVSLSGKAEFYAMGNVIEGIQSKLDQGIALISIQKSDVKDYGEGGQYSVHLSSLYLTVDYNRITVKKAKEWYEHNPNNESYGFTLANSGTKFQNIRLITKCKLCWGSGHRKNGECDECRGTGYVDADYPTVHSPHWSSRMPYKESE